MTRCALCHQEIVALPAVRRGGEWVRAHCTLQMAGQPREICLDCVHQMLAFPTRPPQPSPRQKSR